MEFDFLKDILLQDNPSEMIRMNENKIFKIIPELSKCKDFKQNNIWHIYDVYEHILHVIDGVPKSIDLRLAALFHDIGKPYVYTEDKSGIGHFYNHWNKSKEIFDMFAQKYVLENDIRTLISNLILYHDLNIGKIDDFQLNNLVNIFGENGIIKLFQLKRSDLLAQNEQFHYMLDDYNIQESNILTKIRKVK